MTRKTETESTNKVPTQPPPPTPEAVVEELPSEPVVATKRVKRTRRRSEQLMRRRSGGGNSAAPFTRSKTAAGRKTRRFHPGTVALRQIKHYQRSGSSLIRRAPFVRMVRQIVASYNPELRLQADATLALQEASEALLTGMFGDANLLAIHARRSTVSRKDLLLARALRGEVPPSQTTDAKQ